MGKGLLPTTVFLTGDGETPPPDYGGYAFQPRRVAGALTPGEQTLVSNQLRRQQQRQRPSSSAGRLLGSSSSSAALVSTGSHGMRA